MFFLILHCHCQPPSSNFYHSAIYHLSTLHLTHFLPKESYNPTYTLLHRTFKLLIFLNALSLPLSIFIQFHTSFFYNPFKFIFSGRLSYFSFNLLSLWGSSYYDQQTSMTSAHSNILLSFLILTAPFNHNFTKYNRIF